MAYTQKHNTGAQTLLLSGQSNAEEERCHFTQEWKLGRIVTFQTSGYFM